MIDKKSIIILKYLNKVKEISVEELSKSINFDAKNSVEYLDNHDYVVRYDKGSKRSGERIYCYGTSTVYITPKGKSYLENKFKNFILKWYPLVVSTISIIISLISILK